MPRKKITQLLFRAIIGYLTLAGLGVHLAALILWLVHPVFWLQAQETLINTLAPELPHNHPGQESRASDRQLAELADMAVDPWSPAVDAESAEPVSLQGGSLASAAAAMQDGDTLLIPPGTYRESFVVSASNVTLRGVGHVHLQGSAHGGKAAIVLRGHGSRVVNIECSGISVADANGACIRLAGRDLSLSNVYFHDSQQGLLTGADPGTVEIRNSRFERLGWGGRAHGVYVGGGQLLISDSQFLAARNEGHEIKSRAAMTRIERSTIASLASDDSRLIDVSNGGVLIIRESVLQQGPGSKHWDALGFALEGRSHPDNRIELYDNVFILERQGANVLLNAPGDIGVIAIGNRVISAQRPALGDNTLHFRSRKAAGLGKFPMLPSAGRP